MSQTHGSNMLGNDCYEEPAQSIKPFAYSISDIDIYYDQVCGNFHVFPDIKGIINYLEKQAIYPSELLNNDKYKIESHSLNGREELQKEKLIQKIDLSQKDLEEIEKFVEDFICKQEESDRKFLEEHPGEWMPRFSGIFCPDRKDKQKYIEQHTKNKSWKWVDFENK